VNGCFSYWLLFSVGEETKFDKLAALAFKISSIFDRSGMLALLEDFAMSFEGRLDATRASQLNYS
jgi:hypothetical protein